MNILVFDIETVPDTESGAKLYDMDGLSPQEIAKAMFHKRSQESGGSEFLRHHLHKIVAISIAHRQKDSFKVRSIGNVDSLEKDIIKDFYKGVDIYSPTIVSWNGNRFDFPVLHYRSLLHGVQASRYWEKGDEDQSFRWNNYLSRYHERHTDLMDVLANFTGSANAPLDEIATMLGFPGKMGMSGAKVWDHYCDGDIEGIRNYCETDVLNTYLVYLRFLFIKGTLNNTEYQQEIELVLDILKSSDKAHLTEFANTCKSK